MVRYWDDPVLSVVCPAVEDNEFGPELIQFGLSLLKTMENHNGLGLAAPQVGVAKRIFAMAFPDDEEKYRQWSPDGKCPDWRHPRKPIVVCNPTLMLDGKTLYEREGCLSLPGIFEQVARAEKVTMQYRQTDGQPQELPLVDLNARVAQHEFDHLNGIMFFNYTDIRTTYGRRMQKQVSKQVLRNWEKEKKRRGL